MSRVEDLKITIFADGADIAGILEICANPRVSGLTTNPTPMHKASVKDYEAFACKLLERVIDQPISFEVLPTTPDHDRSGSPHRVIGARTFM
jgi:transaldolase